MFPAVLVLNIGFIAAELVIQAQAMTGVTAALSIPEWIVVLAVPSAVIGIFGYRWIHRVMQATAVVVGVALVVMLDPGAAARLAARPPRPLWPARPPACSWPGSRCWSSTCCRSARSSSDYTRYLPARTNGRRLFWAIYAGNVLATVVSCAIGAYLAALLPTLPRSAAVGQISGKWALVIMALSLVNANTFNAYTGSFQVIAFGSMWRRFKAESVAVRVIPFLAVLAAGTVIACYGYQQFVTNLSNFLDDLLVLLHPVVGGQPGRLLPRPPR